MEVVERDCPDCEHCFADHVVVAEEFATVRGVENVPVAGPMYCPVEGCECEGTWSLAVPE